jgi:ATP-dependent DNA helicase RecG
MLETGFSSRIKFKQNYIQPLLNMKLLTMTIPEVPNSPNQKYVATSSGKSFIGSQ